MVRITNTKVICQVVYSKIQGDCVLAEAQSTDLQEYGVKVGLSNWAAAYCTGLLCARRLLSKVGLAEQYPGTAEPTGEFSEVEPVEDGPRPFKCFLDVGLHRTTTGSKVFAAMKGASDGGVYVPHSDKRFPGYDTATKQLDSDTVRDYIFGENVAEYMRVLREDDEEAFKRQFARYLSEGVGADDLEEMYASAHSAIREEPFKGGQKKIYSKEEVEAFKEKSKALRQVKLTREEREEKIKNEKAAFLASLGVQA